MRKLFDNASQQQKDNYLDEVLEPLFEYGLDTDRTEKKDLFDTGVEGFRNVKVPYLNGGLFDRDVLDEPIVVCRASGTCVTPKDCQRKCILSRVLFPEGSSA